MHISERMPLKMIIIWCIHTILHFFHPTLFFSGSVNLKKTKFNTKLEHEYISNFKFVQSAFKREKIEKVGGHTICSSYR